MAQAELLLTVPTVELHQVHHQQDQLLHKDTLTLSLDQGLNPDASSIIAQVANVTWRLQKTVPCLKSDDRTYIFSLPEQAGVFYCVIVSPDTPPFIMESFEGVLRSSTDFSTMHQSSENIPEPGTGPVPPPRPSNMSKQVSEGLVVGSGMASQGVVALAGLAATGIQKVADIVVKNTTPSPTGMMAPETRANRLEKATVLVTQAGAVIRQFATQAGVAADSAGKTLSKSFGNNQSVQKVQSNPDVQHLGAASKTAGSQLLVGLKDAARIISQSTKAAMQKYNAHKYPGEAAPINPAMFATVPTPTSAAGHPSGAPPLGMASPQYPGASPPQYPGAGPPAGYPTGPIPPRSDAPQASHPAAHGQPAPNSGMYPAVPPPNLYPHHVPQPHTQ